MFYNPLLLQAHTKMALNTVLERAVRNFDEEIKPRGFEARVLKYSSLNVLQTVLTDGMPGLEFKFQVTIMTRAEKQNRFKNKL